MEFSIKTKELKRALSILGPCVAGRSTKKIFECVKLEASPEGGSVRLSGTDLEWAAVVDVPVAWNMGPPGPVVVPLFQLAQLAKLKAERINFTAQVETHGIDLRAEWNGPKTSAARTIMGEDPAQFPELPDSKPGVKSPWRNTPNIGAVLVESLPFCGKEAARFVLNGVRIGDGRVAATDGRRLYARSVDGLPNDASAIIGVRALARLPKPIIRAIDCCRVTGRFVQLGGAGFTLTCRVMEGTFPDYRQVMPRALSYCPVDAEAWLEAIAAVAPCVSVEAQAVSLSFNGCVKVDAAGGDAKGEARIPQETGELEGVGPLGFNPSYLCDFLKLAPTRFGAKDANCAAMFTTDNGAELVLMPVLID